MSIRKVCFLLLIIFLSACQTPQMAKNASDYELCEQVLVYGNTRYYNDELVARRVNCQQYMSLLNQRSQQMSRNYQNATTAPQPVPQASFSRGSQITSPMNSNPQIPTYQNKTTNCNPNGFGGYTCQ
jgi:hypothetical protein